ncbi:hypothetical protein KIK06_25255 [Nocardiopsis sp. EMB25]|uniref:hypothetical protein n=1 Tax=Nocardiopsis sp. EMB25 TaxID=2835867 RepID=UPI0022845346|nr:hypothetical protein [Nocardiopsis sp. EMB25]MCY9787194.1 hypothetical protein [Nocardiopsis sp. EMB25]
MNVTTRLGLFALGLVAVFAAMFGVGSLAGPFLPDSVIGQTGSTAEDPHGGAVHEDH